MSQIHDAVPDEMPAEIDFPGGTRGRFYRAGAKPNLPFYVKESDGDLDLFPYIL
jgi:hypothetical protein